MILLARGLKPALEQLVHVLSPSAEHYAESSADINSDNQRARSSWLRIQVPHCITF